MSNWKYSLDIKHIWKNNQPVEQKGKSIATNIKATIPKSHLNCNHDDYDEEIENIVENFENITGFDDVSPVEEFDDTMTMLYDWGDQEIQPYDKWPKNKKCWIGTS